MQRNGGPSLEGWYQVAAMCLSDALELPTMVLWGGRIRLTRSSDVFLWFGVCAISISFTHRTGSCGDTYWHLQLLDQVGLAMSTSFFVNDADPWHEDHEGLQPKNRSNESSVLVHLSPKDLNMQNTSRMIRMDEGVHENAEFQRFLQGCGTKPFHWIGPCLSIGDGGRNCCNAQPCWAA